MIQITKGKFMLINVQAENDMRISNRHVPKADYTKGCHLLKPSRRSISMSQTLITFKHQGPISACDHLNVQH